MCQSPLQPGWGYTSIDLNVSYLRGVTLDSGLITFTGHVIKRGRRVMFATAEGVDAAGNTVATATSSLLVMAPTQA
ncbi:MAG: PaaI family thioesterase [Pseudolysinimonas sp.]